MAGRSKKRTQSTGRQAAATEKDRAERRDQVLEDKRAQFQTTGGSRRTGLIMAVLAVALVAAVAAVAVLSGGEETVGAPTAPTAAGGETVSIPVADLSDGKADYFSYDAGGTTVDYFVVKSPDGELRAAFDACDVCYPQKKGYSQDGDAMICNNCGQTFPTSEINIQAGGCNPSPLDRTLKGDQLVIEVADLQAGVPYFE